jgi:hypothetical protein
MIDGGVKVLKVVRDHDEVKGTLETEFHKHFFECDHYRYKLLLNELVNLLDRSENEIIVLTASLIGVRRGIEWLN